MTVIFLIGALGTTLGALLAFFLLRKPFGNESDLARGAAMMTGTYTVSGKPVCVNNHPACAGGDLYSPKSRGASRFSGGRLVPYLPVFVCYRRNGKHTVITKSPLLPVFTAVTVIVNMLFCFIGAKLLKFDLESAIIASNANIGDPTTAAGMAISHGRTALVGQAMLIGTFGYVLGNYMGTIVAIALHL